MSKNTIKGEGWKPTILMVVATLIFSGMNILLKLALHDGMDPRVIVAYRFIFGAAFIVPLAFFFERGVLAQNLLLESLALTSATFVSAIINLIPAITFVVAVCSRLENLGWNTAAGKAKVLGTLIGVGGAVLFTFYKGPDITLWKTNINLMDITSNHPSHKSENSNLVLGIFVAMISCVCYSLWLIAQGIVGSGIMFTLIALCVAMRGPLFVSVFNPLMLIIVAMVGSLVLDEKLHLGSLLGAILIIFGLYVVLWGKGKEMKKINQLVPEENAVVEDEVIREKSKDKNEENQIELIINPSTEK
ncbi:hypothetical protein ACH5RR_022482 [Cinchona calisaya]|uniref:WAT1-related protein n=1 Tax=Cinchona calisaya TaxID=153742 RepID=A0ABD2ZBB3_9GENT